jgi:hypothetical protein
MKAYLSSLIRTFKLDDANVLTVTAVATVIGQICSGVIPVLALVVAVYQIRIQRIRLRSEELKLKEAGRRDDES